MHEVLNVLPGEARVLDLGSGPHGSFSTEQCPALVIRCDLIRHASNLKHFVCADARMLPFAPDSFDAVILNHSLEHFVEPDCVLREIGRVIRHPGWLWVAVPDGSTFSDSLYRWVSRGGGHVNRFSDVDALARMIAARTGLPHAGTRLLLNSYAFLNRHNGSLGFGRRMYLFGRGAEWLLRLGTLVLRTADQWFGTRTSIYGWGLCFGSDVHFETRPCSNVCIRCGSGCWSEWLAAAGHVRRGRLLSHFLCPRCGAKNYMTDDRRFAGMR